MASLLLRWRLPAPGLWLRRQAPARTGGAARRAPSPRELLPRRRLQQGAAGGGAGALLRGLGGGGGARGAQVRLYGVVSTHGIRAGSGGRASQHAWKLAVAGAAGSLLYHLHGKSTAQQQALALSQHGLDAHERGIVVPLTPPADFRHPFEGSSLAWRAFYVTQRVIKLLCIFAPFAAASALLPFFSEDAEFRKWYLTLMVRTLEDAGASFQKLGQWLSMRPDLFDQQVIQALSGLRDDGPRHSFAHTRKLLESAFNCPLEVIFEWLEEDAVASGSVAQVHRGRLRDSFLQDCIAHGDQDNHILLRDVAVKVLHPGVVESAWVDGDIIFGFVKVLAAVTGVSLVMPFDRDSFCRAMTRQLDFTWEAYNLKQFHQNFAGDAGIEFPRVVAGRDAVLIESWCPGKSIAHLFSAVSGDGFCVVPASKGAGEEVAGLVRRGSSALAAAHVSASKKKRLAGKIFDMTIKMYLRDNYIHGDLHGGNLLYSTDPEDDRVYVLDAGLTTALQPDWASPFGYFLHALTTGNADSVADKLLMFNINDAAIDSAAFRAELHHVGRCLPP
jgi:aarF domain-containing kinase